MLPGPAPGLWIGGCQLDSYLRLTAGVELLGERVSL